jgi:hypothetical protein
MNKSKHFFTVVFLLVVMISSFVPASLFAEDQVDPPAVTQGVDGCPNCHQPDPTPTPKPGD